MRVFLCLCTVAAFHIYSSAYAREQIQLLITRQFHGDEVTAETGEKWFGLYPNGDNYKLVQSTISVETVRDNCLDIKEDEKTGKLVTVNQAENPLFLIRGLEGLANGPVETVFSGIQFLYPGQSLHFHLASRSDYYLAATGEGKVHSNGRLSFFENYKIILFKGDTFQEIACFGEMSSLTNPAVIWAGDLDGDGNLDLFFDLTDHYNVRKYTLFLSTRAKEDELLSKVAEFRSIGC